ncbi:MAG: AI-2E family transporter [Oscillospiraceae bacterium]|nr:AI-2E family transporter [Oscillospiraceae bacterium]
MTSSPWRKALIVLGIFAGSFVGLRYLLPVLLPFLIGALLALAAEPAVGLGVRRLRMPRWLSAGLGVTVTLVLLIATVWLLGALAVRELGQLANALPDVRQTAQQGMILLQDWLIGLADRAPDGLRSLLTQLVLELFGSGSALLQQATGRIPGILSGLLTRIPDSAIGLGTGILASFMISARLPDIKAYCSRRLPPAWKERYLPALHRMRKTVGSWLKAQLKLMSVTYGIVTVGLLLTGISYSPVWAVLVAVVDAVPVLGTGTVLIPWAVIAVLQSQPLRALGLVCTYIAAFLTRTVLEPRLVGKHLGLDPLVTLVFFYVGYKFWGILGMLTAPLLATAVKSLTEKAR